MWIECPACGGSGVNGPEDPCITCGGRGAVFQECCGCRDCNGEQDEFCGEESCPKCSRENRTEVSTDGQE